MAVPQYPYMFQKPLSCLQEKSDTFYIPKAIGDEDVNFEVELGVLISSPILPRSTINAQNFLSFIGGYFLLLDYTDKRILVRDATNGGPFTLSKCQDNFLVLSDFISKERIPDPHKVELILKIDDEEK